MTDECAYVHARAQIGYKAGSVVWAKFESFPFWTALVTELHGNKDIDAETRKELDEQAGMTTTKGKGGKKQASGANKKELVRAIRRAYLTHTYRIHASVHLTCFNTIAYINASPTIQVLVKFFDTGDYSWIPRNKVCPYKYGSIAPDAGKGKKNTAANDPSYLRAIELAQEYLSSHS